MATVTATPEAGQIVRQDFNGTETQAVAETSAMAIAEREKALVGALFLMAERHPRSVARFESGILKECERPGFAEVARYAKPQRTRNRETGEWEDGFIYGWSIRFAEAVMRHWTNVSNDNKIVYEDEYKRIIRFMCVDLESNLTLCSELQLNKTVERRADRKGDPPKGRDVLGQRQTSTGNTVFIVAATEDELQQKQAAAWSKFIRNTLRFCPGDILDRCEEQVKATLAGMSPEASIARITKSFDSKKVTLIDLQEYLGHALSTITPSEIDELRGVYASLSEGDTWASIMEAKQPQGTVEAAEKVAEEKIARMKQEQSSDHPAKAQADIATSGGGLTSAAVIINDAKPDNWTDKDDAAVNAQKTAKPAVRKYEFGKKPGA